MQKSPHPTGSIKLEKGESHHKEIEEAGRRRWGMMVRGGG